MNPKVDKYLSKAQKWQEELEALRTIILDCGLTEELKWGVPCYTYLKANVVIIGELKDSCVLSFFKGALLQDTNRILIKPGQNTQSARMIQFTNLRDISKMAAVLKSYIFEAIELEKAGLKVKFKKNPEPFPTELRIKFEKHPLLKKAFYALTPGRQRGYILYFSAPKQSKTKTSRIEKYEKQILKGKGLNER
jgi:uncharacterized protein YdeI (YjbR/CyaY-like superfamily)